MIGPTRFSPTPYSLQDLPEIDAVLISHDHYDYLDSDTIKKIHAKSKGHVRFFCGLGVKTCLLGLGVGLKPEEVTELDWWDGSTTIGGRCRQRQSCVHAYATSQWKSSVKLPNNIVVLLGPRGDTKRRRRVTTCRCIIFVF